MPPQGHTLSAHASPHAVNPDGSVAQVAAQWKWDEERSVTRKVLTGLKRMAGVSKKTGRWMQHQGDEAQTPLQWGRLPKGTAVNQAAHIAKVAATREQWTLGLGFHSVARLPPVPSGAGGAPTTSVPDQLEKLAQLRRDGLLNDGEFEAAKARALAQAPQGAAPVPVTTPDPAVNPIPVVQSIPAGPGSSPPPKPEEKGKEGKDAVPKSIARTAKIRDGTSGDGLVSAHELSGSWLGYRASQRQGYNCHCTTLVAHDDDTFSLANPACDTANFIPVCCFPFCCLWKGDTPLGDPPTSDKEAGHGGSIHHAGGKSRALAGAGIERRAGAEMKNSGFLRRADEYKRIGDSNRFAPTALLMHRDGTYSEYPNFLAQWLEKDSLVFKSATSGGYRGGGAMCKRRDAFALPALLVGIVHCTHPFKSCCLSQCGGGSADGDGDGDSSEDTSSYSTYSSSRTDSQGGS